MSKSKTPKAKKAAKPKKVAKPDYTSPAALQRYDFETQREATLKEQDVENAKSSWLTFKERASQAKKGYEAVQFELNTYIRERAEGRGKPPKPDLFNEANQRVLGAEMEAANRQVATVTKLAESITDNSTVWPPEDLWKQFPIERLAEYGVTAKDIEHIQAGECKRVSGVGPILTMGDLSRFTSPIGDGAFTRGYHDLKGIGQAGVDRISNAEAAFWAAWRAGVGEKFAAEKGLVRPEPKVSEPVNDQPTTAETAKPKKAKKGAKHDVTTLRGGTSDGPPPAEGIVKDAIRAASAGPEPDAANGVTSGADGPPNGIATNPKDETAEEPFWPAGKA